ncbi:MAG: LSM domain protein [Ruminococcaceae bacterium]|nr:LSM domain protein [Oscillospiraceae bacterium]
MEDKYLYSLLFKKVLLIDSDGDEWRGKVDTYFSADENENGEVSIALDIGEKNKLIEFSKSEIKSIQEIKEDR